LSKTELNITVDADQTWCTRK